MPANLATSFVQINNKICCPSNCNLYWPLLANLSTTPVTSLHNKAWAKPVLTKDTYSSSYCNFFKQVGYYHLKNMKKDESRYPGSQRGIANQFQRALSKRNIPEFAAATVLVPQYFVQCLHRWDHILLSLS